MIVKTQKRKETVLGSCSMDNLNEFNSKLSEFKKVYGSKNVWFDRCNISRTITFLTH